MSATPDKAGTYVEKDAYLKAMAAPDMKTVLFFHASWCPACKAADKAFAESVPAGLRVVKMDFDHSDELKKKYGVTQQHTFVQVDDMGKQLKKWSGSKSGDDVAAKVM